MHYHVLSANGDDEITDKLASHILEVKGICQPQPALLEFSFIGFLLYP